MSYFLKPSPFITVPNAPEVWTIEDIVDYGGKDCIVHAIKYDFKVSGIEKIVTLRPIDELTIPPTIK